MSTEPGVTGMKSLVRQAICSTGRSRLISQCLWHPLSRASQLAIRDQGWAHLHRQDELDAAIASLQSACEVESGPFAGLQYPTAKSVGSTLYAKLLGCYELEVVGAIEEAIARTPSVVVDIGAAEGYYAIGLALRLPGARIVAYDTDSTARDCCIKMAAANGVASQVTIHGLCDQATLKAFTGQRAFLLCDCEGFENTLFDNSMAGALREADILIETHDFIRPLTTKRLRDVLSNTHDVTVLSSVSDFARPTVFPHPSAQHLTIDSQTFLMAEGRPSQMHWLWCKSREPRNA